MESVKNLGRLELNHKTLLKKETKRFTQQLHSHRVPHLKIDKFIMEFADKKRQMQVLIEIP